MTTATLTRLDLIARDTTRQRKFEVKDVSGDVVVSDLVRGLLARMGIPQIDSAGMPQSFHLFRADGVHVRSTERVSESLRSGDEVTLQPDVQAG